METVAVVVVTYHSAHLLADLIESLDEGLRGVEWHLTVVDNDSADRSLERARQLAPDATLVQTGRNAGYAAGINAGVDASPAHSAVLVLNADVRLLPGCVTELLRALRSSAAGIAVPHLVDGEGSLIETIRREPTVLRMLADAVLGARRAGRFKRLGEVVTGQAAYDQQVVVDWAEGSTVLVSSECWGQCGPWDESFFLYSEETEFALRARDLGFAALYVPTAHAVHLEGESSRSPALWTLLTLNRLRLFRRRNGRVRTAAYWGALTLRESGRALQGRPTSRAALRALLSPARVNEERGPHSIRRTLPPATSTAGR